MRVLLLICILLLSACSEPKHYMGQNDTDGHWFPLGNDVGIWVYGEKLKSLVAYSESEIIRMNDQVRGKTDFESQVVKKGVFMVLIDDQWYPLEITGSQASNYLKTK